MRPLNNKNNLFELLAQGARVITPNNRLSANLLQHYFSYSQQQTVIKPQCQPYGATLIQLYNLLRLKKPHINHPKLLNTMQCQQVWRQIIRASSHITYNEGLLASVMEAWSYCEQWLVEPKHKGFDYTPQTHQFQQWWQQFNAILQKKHFITELQLITYLLQENQVINSSALIWSCFDDFTPQQVAFQNHLEKQGVLQYQYDLKEKSTPTYLMAAPDQKEEHQQLICWLLAQLEQNHQRIGVVVPSLQQESKQLFRLLSQHIDSSLFNISLGKALVDFSIIAHALRWLRLDESCDRHQAALLLQSPFIKGAQEEFVSRSQYLQDSYLLQNAAFSLRVLQKEIDAVAPLLAAQLKAVKPFPPKASPQQWVDLFLQRLNLLGFPGDEGINSENYQCYNRFVSLLDEYRQLQCVCDSLSQNEAIEALQLVCQNTIFQAQKTQAPIQILGLLEASGCEFDSLWIMGLTDQCLPQKTRLSAFIPPALQKELKMPHSLADRELLFAQKTLQRLQRGAVSSLTLSFPAMQGDTPCLPCALITSYPAATYFSHPSQDKYSSSLLESDECFEVDVQAEEVIPGGTALLGNQAKCPFKAFAEHRLAAKPLSQSVEGVDAKEKGKMLHKVMELIWTQLKTQAKLLSLATDELDAIIDQSIDEAMRTSLASQPLLKAIEELRLKRVVRACLEWEKQRDPFVVQAIEQAYTFRLGTLDINLRVDRLDKVGDKKWVIDYKSSLPLNKPWNEDRPKEPQLLLYALLDEEINTLMFLQIKTGQLICSGLSEDKQEIKGISSIKREETWSYHRETWLQQLTLLAQEIQEGHCPPQPTNASICQFCDFQNLCRV